MWVLILTILSLDGGTSNIEVIEGFESKINCELIGNEWVNSFENVTTNWKSHRGPRVSAVCAPVKEK